MLGSEIRVGEEYGWHRGRAFGLPFHRIKVVDEVVKNPKKLHRMHWLVEFVDEENRMDTVHTSGFVTPWSNATDWMEDEQRLVEIWTDGIDDIERSAVSYCIEATGVSCWVDYHLGNIGHFDDRASLQQIISFVGLGEDVFALDPGVFVDHVAFGHQVQVPYAACLRLAKAIAREKAEAVRSWIEVKEIKLTGNPYPNLVAGEKAIFELMKSWIDDAAGKAEKRMAQIAALKRAVLAGDDKEIRRLAATVCGLDEGNPD